MDRVLDREQRRLVVRGAVRALAVTVLLTVAYFVLPLDLLKSVPLVASLAGGVVVLGAVIAVELRRVAAATRPGVRAIEALALVVPLFLFLFAAVYYLTSAANPDWFSQTDLNRMDALYFAVTVFATVGFGDITATADQTRAMVTVQMILDLIVLGAVVRSFVSAAQVAKDRGATDEGPGAPKGVDLSP